MVQRLIKQIQSLVAEKRALADREKQLIDELARALPHIGYEIVPRSPDAGPEPTNRPASPTSSGRPAAGAGRVRKPLVCPHCRRRFARPSNLGRHLSATHGRNRRKKAA